MSGPANLTNQHIAKLIDETADLMEIADMDAFRVRSYRNASVIIQNYLEPVAEIAADPEREVTEIQGIGKGIKEVLDQILDHGSFDRRDELLKRYPPTLLEFLKIPGLGPKSIAQIISHFRVSTMEGLETLCREGKLQSLPRMGEKLEQKILRGIENYRQRAGRYLISFADRTAQGLIEFLSGVKGVDQVIAAGSLRRGKETIGDIDLLATGPQATNVFEKFADFPDIVEMLAWGEKKASARVGPQAIQVDVRALDPESYGAALQYFTGSKEHSVAVRDRAVRMGLRLNEYGLFRTKDDRRVAGETEEEIYEKLGMQWIPPEMRENNGEIELAIEGELPELVVLEDVRGDLHMHTTESDGHSSLEEMAAAAKEAGHSYIAVTDHSKALAMANGLNEKRLLEQIRRVQKFSKEAKGITVLAGCEVDILRDGKLDIDDEVLAQLDVVIGSVHSYMNLEREEMTDRLLAAVENPHLQILGHPTGRLLLRRDPYPYDFEKVAAEASKRKVCFEINSSPERLDLDPAKIRGAKAKGVRFVISTDAHHARELANLKYGVLTARRGWLEAGDVLNTRTVAAFRKGLRKA